jgi:endonuclease-3
MREILWGEIFRRLEGWRRAYLAAEGAEEAAVTAVAGEHGEAPGASAEVWEKKVEKSWAVLVSTVLSLRTKDEVTRVASRRLLGWAPSPEALLALGEAETARLAYPAGFYRTKAANLRKIAGILIERYGGRAPADMEALLALPGVGRKTANLVITEAFDMDGICVDIHVHRISNRVGLVSTSTPLETEESLRDCLPKKYWKRINSLLVLYGQRVCRPVSPFCSRCGIRGWCGRHGVEKFR